MFKTYRKTAMAEINTEVIKVNENNEICYLARDSNNHEDTYLMPITFFKQNYEPAGNGVDANVGRIFYPVSAVITLGRDAPEPTRFLDAKTKQWVSVANKEEFKKANCKWNARAASEYIARNYHELKELNGFEMSIDNKLVL